MLTRVVLACVLLCDGTTPVQARYPKTVVPVVFQLSVNGDDLRGDGTLVHPWHSLARALRWIEGSCVSVLGVCVPQIIVRTK